MIIENITSKGISLDRNGQSMQREVYEREIVKLQSNWNSLREINNEAREYLTSYEAISTIQGLDNIEKNKQLDENTINEMTNRYLKVHHKLLSILDKMNELEGKDKDE